MNGKDVFVGRVSACGLIGLGILGAVVGGVCLVLRSKSSLGP